MSLLRCPKFPRCLTGDAGNFDRGHSLTLLPLPPAALGSLPTGAMRPRNDTSQEIWRKTGTAGLGHPALQKEYGLRDQRAHWLRNDISQEMRYKSGGRTGSSAPTHLFQQNVVGAAASPTPCFTERLAALRRGDPCGRPQPERQRGVEDAAPYEVLSVNGA